MPLSGMLMECFTVDYDLNDLLRSLALLCVDFVGTHINSAFNGASK